MSGILTQHAISHWILAKTVSQKTPLKALQRRYGAVVWVLRKINVSRRIEEENRNSKQTGDVHHFLTLGAWARRWEPEVALETPLDLAQEQKGGLLTLREGEVPLYPFIFLHPAIHGSGCGGCNSTGTRTMRKGSLPFRLVELGSPRGWANPDTCCFVLFCFLSFSLSNLPPLGSVASRVGNCPEDEKESSGNQNLQETCREEKVLQSEAYSFLWTTGLIP